MPRVAARRGPRGREAGALAARTEIVVERRFTVGDATLARVEARPASGRHHQIRVHLRAAGAPILFDPLYGRGIPAQLLVGAPAGRLALHALGLALDHPATGRPLEVEAPWPTTSWRSTLGSGGRGARCPIRARLSSPGRAVRLATPPLPKMTSPSPASTPARRSSWPPARGRG